jgi:hypothetical protein
MDWASNSARLNESTEAISGLGAPLRTAAATPRAPHSHIATGRHLSVSDEGVDGRLLEDRYVGRLTGLDALINRTGRVVSDRELVPGGAFETAGKLGERRFHDQSAQQLNFTGSRGTVAKSTRRDCNRKRDSENFPHRCSPVGGFRNRARQRHPHLAIGTEAS